MALLNTANSVLGDGSDERMTVGLSGSETYNITLSDDYFISTWVKSTANAGSDEFLYGIHKGGSSSFNGEVYLMIHSSGVPRLVTTQTGTNTNVLGTTVISNDGTWHHIMGVWNQGSVTLWLDGTQEGSGTATQNGAIQTSKYAVSAFAYVFGGVASNVFTGNLTHCVFGNGWSDSSVSDLVARYYNSGNPIDITSDSDIKQWYQMPGVASPSSTSDFGINTQGNEANMVATNFELADAVSDFPVGSIPVSAAGKGSAKLSYAKMGYGRG